MPAYPRSEADLGRSTIVTDGTAAARERWFGTLLAHSRDLIAVLDEKANVLYVSPAARTVLGYDPDELVGQSILELIHPDDLDASSARFFSVTRAQGHSPGGVLRFRAASGEWRVIEATSTNCLEDPAIGGIVVNAHDVTKQTNLSRAMATLSQVNDVLVHATDESALLADSCRAIVTSGEYLLAWVGYLEHDEERRVRPVGAAGSTGYLEQLRLRWAEDSELGQGPGGAASRTGTVQVLNDTHRSRAFDPWRELADSFGLRSICSLPLFVADSTVGILNIYAGEPGVFGPPEVDLLRELADDLSYGIGRLRDGRRLAHHEALLRDAERLANVGHWEWDLRSGRIDFLAEEIFTIHGIVPEDWAGTYAALLELVHPDDRTFFAQAIERSLTEGSAELDHRIIRPSGQVRSIRKRTEAIHGDDGSAIRVVGTCQDVTEQKLAAMEIEHAREFLSAITDNMAEGMLATDSQGKVTFANAAAERLLGWSAAELRGESMQTKFHFLNPDGSPSAVEEYPLRAVWAGGETLHIDHDAFVRRDGSMLPVAYSASPLHTGQVTGAVIVFSDVSEQVSERLRLERELEKLSWVGRIRDALDQGRFVLYAQPILDLRTGAVVQHELLIRMLSSSGEIVLPDRFLPTAEEFGLVFEIDTWVVGETARLAARGHAVEFNLSAKSVVNPNMLAVVRNALSAENADPGLVVCEITETALLRDTTAAEAFVRGLNDMGCRVALDDFGAGYGGFAYLKRLPVSYLKIDREFVRDLLEEASSRHVVSAVVSLARAFGLETVAEAAEDQATLELLRQLGVDCVQGYVIARPAPVAEMLGVAPDE